jgi:hypothetical protein
VIPLAISNDGVLIAAMAVLVVLSIWVGFTIGRIVGISEEYRNEQRDQEILEWASAESGEEQP